MIRRVAAAVLAVTAVAPLPQRADPLTGMTFSRIPPGRFTMGSPVTEKQREAQERPQLRGIERLTRAAIPVIAGHPYAPAANAANAAAPHAAEPHAPSHGDSRPRHFGGRGRRAGGGAPVQHRRATAPS